MNWLSISTKRSGHHSVLGWLLCQQLNSNNYLFDQKVPHKIIPDKFDIL